MSASVRPAKRVRQRLACEPCRRKKSRCPGEKPACSFCSRLGQTCYYANEHVHSYLPHEGASPVVFSDSEAERARKTEERLQLLESKLAEVLGSGSHQDSQEREIHQPSPASPSKTNLIASPRAGRSSSTSISLPSWDTMQSIAENYLLYCDCQPLPLFHADNFVASFRSRDLELQLSVLALALRFSNEEFFGSNPVDELIKSYAEEARRIVMRRVTDGPIELSTLQSLCLLSLVDFTNGNKDRASIHSSLAMNLAHCASLTTESPINLAEMVREERRRCFWSIFLLKRLHGADVNVLDFSGEENFPWYPRTNGMPPYGERHAASTSNAVSDNDVKDLGVVAYSIQQSEVWFKTTKYARRRATPSSLPPWSPQSEYAIIVAQTMDFETRMPSKHRYKPSGFAQKTPEELQSNRGYWGPWLFTQFVYHTNLCLLNHPLILALRLRSFKLSMPEMFLQHTSDLISTHANWIIYLIDTLSSKSFKVTDPFMAHCAAIVATIFLQESFSDDEVVRKEKQINFGKCFDFIRDIAQQWPHIARLADKLQRLQDTVSASYHMSANPQTPTHGLLIDLGRFWEVLEYSSASEIYDSAGQLFGSSLYSRRRLSTVEVTDMSSLPTPTRLESAVSMTRQSTEAPASVRPTSQPYPETGAVDPILGMDLANGNFYGYTSEPTYSNDELAVLADSFFNQRENFIGSVDEWWKTGNL